MKTLSYLLQRCLYLLFSKSPDFVSVTLGRFGHTDIIKRSEKISFIANLYDTRFRIHVRSDYAVERGAVCVRRYPYDPYNALAFSSRSLTGIDIGANVGTISLGMLHQGCTKVHAIEPGPLHSRLCQNILLNDLQESVVPYQLGLSDVPGILYWAEDKNNLGNAHLLKSLDMINLSKIPTQFDREEFVEVEVITLDEFVTVNEIGKIDIIKIDVEGMEWNVLKGGLKVIEKNLPSIIAETHRVASDMMGFDCMTPMFERLYEMGYKSYSLNSEGNLVEFIYPNFGFDTFFVHPENQVIRLD